MAVVAGDIAIVGYNSTNPDQIAILAINAIAAGDGFFITDGGFISATGIASTTFRGTEGFVQYVAPTGGIAAGSVLIIDAGASNTPATLTVTRNGGGAAGTVTALANTGGTATVFNFAAAGDQISLYTVASGTHLTGNPNIIAFADFGSGAYTGAGSTNASNIPTIAGGQVLDLALDNAIFTNAANVAAGNIAAFNVAANFSEQNTTVYNLTTLASGAGSAFTAGNDTASNAATNDAIDGLGNRCCAAHLDIVAEHDAQGRLQSVGVECLVINNQNVF